LTDPDAGAPTSGRRADRAPALTERGIAMTSLTRRTEPVLVYEVRYLEAGEPRRARLEAADAAAAVAAAEELTAGAAGGPAPRFELLSAVPAAARIGGRA
jgi:hypothetical protein